MAIRCFKLLSDVDLIAEIKKETDEVITMENPSQILLQQNEQGTIGAGLAPYVPFAAKGIIHVNKTAIAAEIEVEDNLQNEYRRIFGSGIIVGNKNIVGA